MVVARLVKFYFKNGKREEGFEELDLILNKYGRNEKGFRGFISLFSCDQENIVAVLTAWEDDESYQNSEKLLASAVDKIMPLIEKQPEIEHYRIDTVKFDL